MTNKFAHCHPDGNTMWCMHHNGNWIGFPISREVTIEEGESETAIPSEKE
jgi:hypothetical protein